MSAADQPWSPLEHAELLDCIERYRDTRGNPRGKEKLERQRYYCRIAAEVNRLRDRNRPELSGEAVRKQCEQLIKTGANCGNPKLEAFLSEGRAYLSEEYQFNFHDPVDAKPPDRSATVSPLTDLGTPIDESNGYRDRYELRPRAAAGSVSLRVHQEQASPPAAEVRVQTVSPRLFSETISESTSSGTGNPVESKPDFPNLEALGDLDLEELDPRWSDHMYDQARLDTHGIPGRVSKLNRLLVSLADYVKNLLPGLNIRLLKTAVENDEMSPLSQRIAVSSYDLEERYDFQTRLRSVLAQTVKNWVFDARSPFPGSDLIAEEPLRRVEQVLCYKGTGLKRIARTYLTWLIRCCTSSIGGGRLPQRRLSRNDVY